MQRVVWINKSDWKKSGPIVYMGLLNALSFAQCQIETDYFVGYGQESDTAEDLTQFYAVEPSPFLHIHRIKQHQSKHRTIYQQAIHQITQYLQNNDDVLVITRELGALSKLLTLKKHYPQFKLLYESHDFYLTRTHLPKKGWSTLRRQWAERLLIPKADGLICLTEYQRALYQQQFNTLPILALPLGCLTFPKQEVEQRRLQRHVVYIGHLHDYKGSELIFELAKQLKSKNIRLSCYGGSKKQVTQLRLRAKNQSVDSILKFETFISPAQLHLMLESKISIGLVPLQDTFYSRYLTCPVKALDFLSHGLPVVASSLPSIHAVLASAGNYCNSKDAHQFAQQLETLLDNQSAYQTASDKSNQQSHTLRWKLRAEKILQLCH